MLKYFGKRHWNKRLWLWLSIGAVFGVAGSIWGMIEYADWVVTRAAVGRIYSTTERLPAARVALVLGCAQKTANGRENLYFRYRMDACEALYAANKVEYFLLSGDNSRVGYDEPSDMKEALVARGLPAERLICDYAGFSTLDSVLRAKTIFLTEELLVVSQEFHVARAIYLGRQNEMVMIGFAASDVAGVHGVKTNWREKLARVKALIDVNLTKRQPKFGGDVIRIGRRSYQPTEQNEFDECKTLD